MSSHGGASRSSRSHNLVTAPPQPKPPPPPEITITVPIREGLSQADKKNRRSAEAAARYSVPVIEEENENEFRRNTKYRSNNSLSNVSSGSGSVTGGGHRERRISRGGKYGSHSNVSTISGSVNLASAKANGGDNTSNPGQVNHGYTDSTTSVNSLTVIHEQYCSCTRWSRLEKILVIMVSILAFMVVALIIAVGFLADKKPKETHWWVFR